MKQMCWLYTSSNISNRILHLRFNATDKWKPYTTFPNVSVPDYKDVGGSKGFATMQHLLKQGWTIVPNEGEVSADE